MTRLASASLAHDEVFAVVFPDRSQLAELLPDPNLHELARLADAMRTERFGRTTTYAAIGHLDLASGRAHCAICGEDASAFGRDAAITDLHVVLPPEASAEQMLAIWQDVPREAPAATVQLGVAGDLARGGRGLLARLADRGLTVVSDGVRPHRHPALGEDAGREWADFWREAARVGLRGHTAVLYGPDHDLDSVLHQIDAIAAVQRETGVFESVAPVIHRASSYGGVQDGLLTHGSLDLRVLAACRLGLPDVPHVRVLYNRSDLKLAHLSLASGADDLEGHLAFEVRDLSADADAKDLSMREMPLWLSEVGFSAQLRDARMQPVSTTSAGDPAKANEGK